MSTTNPSAIVMMAAAAATQALSTILGALREDFVSRSSSFNTARPVSARSSRRCSHEINHDGSRRSES
jgi:hypothetical protein